MTINQAVREATAQLAAAGIDSAAVEARLLMRYLLAEPGAAEVAGAGEATEAAASAPRAAVDPGTLFLRADDPAPAEYGAWIARRVAREPLQHLSLIHI